MSTQLQKADINTYHEIGNYGVAEIMSMKDTIGKDLSIPQFNLFMHDSVRLGLEPRLKHSFPILYAGKMDFRISFEGFHAMAQRSEGYIGLKMETVCDNEIESFYAETDEEGDIVKVYHRITIPRGKVAGAYAVAKREGKKNLVVFCDKSEFDKYAKKNPQFWLLDDKSLDPDMCKKHVGTRGIKGQFAVAAVAEESTEGMYSDNTEPAVRKEVNPDADPTPITKDTSKNKTKAAEASKAIDVESTPVTPIDEAAERKAINGTIKAKLKILGIISDNDISNYMSKNMTVAGESPTIEERKELLVFIEKEISTKNDELPE